MKLDEDEIRQLIVEEIERQHLKQIITEDMGDWNPLEILRTAGKYYIDLAKSDNPGKQFRKDLKDSGVDDVLQGVSAVPFIGLPFGLASIGLNLAAGNTRKALIQVVATAGAAVGAKAVGAGFSQAAANPRVLQAASRILNSVSQRMGGLPAIGSSITAATRRLGKNLAEATADLAESAAENEIADAVENSKAITVAIKKLSKSSAAKKIKAPKAQRVGGGGEKMYKVGGGFAANRKDSSITNELYSNTENSLREVRTVKITKNLIRKVVKESLNRSQEVLNENSGVVTRKNDDDYLLVTRQGFEDLAKGQEIVLNPAKRGSLKGIPIAIKLLQGEKTIATVLKVYAGRNAPGGTSLARGLLDPGILRRTTGTGKEKATVSGIDFTVGDGPKALYRLVGGKAELRLEMYDDASDDFVRKTIKAEPIVISVEQKAGKGREV